MRSGARTALFWLIFTTLKKWCPGSRPATCSKWPTRNKPKFPSAAARSSACGNSSSYRVVTCAPGLKLPAFSLFSVTSGFRPLCALCYVVLLPFAGGRHDSRASAEGRAGVGGFTLYGCGLSAGCHESGRSGLEDDARRLHHAGNFPPAGDAQSFRESQPDRVYGVVEFRPRRRHGGAGLPRSDRAPRRARRSLAGNRRRGPARARSRQVLACTGIRIRCIALSLESNNETAAIDPSFSGTRALWAKSGCSGLGRFLAREQKAAFREARAWPSALPGGAEEKISRSCSRR